MFTQLILSLFWITFSDYKREQILIQSLMAAHVESIGWNSIKQEPMLKLAPPPIHLSGPIPNEGHPEIVSHEIQGKKYFVLSIKKHIALIEAKERASEKKGNGTPEIPTIIEKPDGKFFIKFPGKNWVDIQTMQADDPFFADLIRAVGNINPPPPPGKGGNGNGDGNGDNSDIPPFRMGDLVVSKTHPEFGILVVVECKKYPNLDGSLYWRVTATFKREPMGSYNDYSATWKDFIFYARVE